MDFRGRFPDLHDRFYREARATWIRLHRASPKYSMQEETNAAFLADVPVSVEVLLAEYRQVERGSQQVGKWLDRDGTMVSAESLAAGHYQRLGYQVLRFERQPITTLVASFFALTIQNPADPLANLCMRHSTVGWTPSTPNTPLIHFWLPEDFGTPQYHRRCCQQLERDLSLVETVPDVVALFDQLVSESTLLRDYLWVNSASAVEAARKVLSILPREVLVESLRWVIEDFWSRQPGWPDLLVHSGDDYRFIEVKSPHDELSEPQMNWFRWAVSESGIPCGILRVKKRRAKAT